MLICVTERPIKAGAISQPIRRTPSWAKSNRQPKSSPALRRAGIWLRNWANPPTTTPKATARIGSANNGASRKADAIIAMLNSTGENAGAAKLRTEFSTPIASAASPIHKRRSEEHTSELQSPCNLVCRLLLEKKKKYKTSKHTHKLHKYDTS